ncbi:hypothetical protein [Sphingomonas corticis]|uniref:Uncharacterized protein n=1 Tax=Sphingomonas corticis TaxID=2722791 RepID=A0ABX1CSB7_9SPHN|nr:hypothetical protein [Sphingomonas corticis]NJR80850.1 hypothetical protein [Sphingomonas corticis]
MQERITIDIPNFAAMDDDQVAGHILTRVVDGRWSHLTRSLMQKLQASKLDLNSHWASTWQGWECPCCQRANASIARVTADGVLLCKLVWHHDHLGDFAKTLLRPVKELDGSDDERARRQVAHTLVFPLVERFAATLVCEDCNNADADMNSALAPDIDRWFSFSPNEISRFILVRANERHELDVIAARSAWQAAEPVFRDRASFARMFAERVNAGRHDREAHGTGQVDSSTNATMLYRMASERSGPRSGLSDMEAGLWARSRATEAHSVAKRKGQRVVAPSTADFAAVCTANAASRLWLRAGEDWICAICERSKFEVTRRGNSGKFGARIQQLRDFCVEGSPESLAWRRRAHDIPLIFGAHQTYAVCQDCRSIVVEAGKVVPGIGEDALRPADLRALIGQPTPHARHQVDRAELTEAVTASAAWQSAAKDYWAHFNEASDAQASVAIFARQLPMPRAKELALARHEERFDLAAGTARERFEWLVSEGIRLIAIAKQDRQQMGDE